MAITHSTVVEVPDDGTSPVGTNEWNAAHTVADESITMGMLHPDARGVTGPTGPTGAAGAAGATGDTGPDRPCWRGCV